MDDDDTGAAWAAYELELQQMLLGADPDYLAWLDRLITQAEIERVQLSLPLNFTH